MLRTRITPFISVADVLSRPFEAENRLASLDRWVTDIVDAKVDEQSLTAGCDGIYVAAGLYQSSPLNSESGIRVQSARVVSPASFSDTRRCPLANQAAFSPPGSLLWHLSF